MASRRRVVLAINPSASFGKGRAVGPRTEERLRAAGYEVTALSEGSMAELQAAARAAIDRGTDALVVVGGDGMVHLGVGLVATTDVPLGIVPSGTGNDAARGLGIPLGDTEAAISRLLASLEAPARTIDAGLIRHGAGQTWFVSVLSAGFDAIVNERANRMRHPKGPSRYTLALLRELIVLHPLHYRLVVDGVSRDARGVLLALANNTSLGGGMQIAPDAELDDGLFDLVLVGPVTRLRFLRLFPKVFSGAHTSLDIVDIVRARSVRIDAPGIVAYADGERIAALPVDVEVRQGALQVLA
ncbi:diacylglycerol kinase family protein [Amnibacterium flavum]|uniref:Diacylglycerol kinase n=2 Tax=Amnibacterium flavum TaxID=2173173 RepID=A0A2V1HY98_9MICO|nr:diacylglycerol kinase family protein [Amnibacterium flavum]PVZ96400.1 diacylglycerol kinase [Amnibacterium flavum]